jgi:hypothetical protein
MRGPDTDTLKHQTAVQNYLLTLRLFKAIAPGSAIDFLRTFDKKDEYNNTILTYFDNMQTILELGILENPVFAIDNFTYFDTNSVKFVNAVRKC